MDRRIRHLAILFLFLFGLLALNVNYIQVIAADDLANNPANKRLLIAEYNVNRGAILASDRSTVLARSVRTDDPLKYLRRYPKPDLYAHLTGFYSFVFGRSELEQAYNDYLAARSAELFPQRLVDDFLGRDRQGADVVTTIDPRLQEIAADGLGSQEGAVAAIRPSTGEVLALVATPSYDPNLISSHDGKSIRRNWKALNKDPDKPMLSNATDQFYAPGSSFKVVVAAAALEAGLRPTDTVPNPPALDLPQTTETLENFGGEHCAGGASTISFDEALTESCNVAFAEIGLKLGAKRLVDQANRFGFSEDVPFDIPFQTGNIPKASAFKDDKPGVALSAIGQKDVRTNVLQSALVAATIANGGVMQEPKLVKEIRDPKGRVIKRTQPSTYGRAMSAGNARTLAEMMTHVVEGGTGTAAQIPGVTVAGKTGTAQIPGQNPAAWFLCFAPDKDIAVAVMVLNGGDLGSEATGGQVAAPIARAVMEAGITG